MDAGVCAVTTCGGWSSAPTLAAYSVPRAFQTSATGNVAGTKRHLRGWRPARSVQPQCHIELVAPTLHQQRGDFVRSGDQLSGLFCAGDGPAVDGKQQVTGLQAGARRCARDAFDHQAGVVAGRTLLVGLQRAQRQPQAPCRRIEAGARWRRG